MARKVTPAQLRAEIRRAEAKQRQAISKYNGEVRKYNRDVKRAVNEHNREVRAHNNRVRTNRQRLNAEIRRYNAQSSTTQYVTYSASVDTLHRSFERVDATVEERPMSQLVLDLAELGEGETANSVGVLNALLDDAADVADDPTLRVPSLKPELGSFSNDLVLRWKGAIFALDPANPDAARHFCTSAREILNLIIQTAAPDNTVAASDPECQRTPQGTPSRRAKIRFLLQRKGVEEQAIENFVEDDLDNIIELFRTFNDGTHGAAGRYTVRQLTAIRQRVESAIKFLHSIAA